MARHQSSIETRYGWAVIWASLAIHTIAAGASTILFVTLKPIAAEFDWPRAVPSMAFALMMLGTGIGGIGMGWWMDKRGVMQPVLFGTVMIALGAALASRAEGMWSLYIANGLLLGLLGEAAMIAPLVANATRWFDRRRGLAVAIITSGQGLAGAIWPPIVHYLNSTYSWRDAYLYYAVFAFVTMLPLALVLRPRPPIPVDAPPGGVSTEGRVMGWSPHAVQGVLWLAVIGCCAAMAMPIVHLASHATDVGYTPAIGAQLLSVLFGASFFSRLAFGLLADRIGGVMTLLIASVIQASMLLALAVVDSLAGLYVAAMLFGIGFAGIMPCYALIIRLLFPIGQVGWRIASQYLFASLGMALGGWLGGAVFDLTGSYDSAFLIGFGFNVLNLFLAAIIYVRQIRIGLNPLPA